jgi:PAS domain S-box-containing protein
MNNLNTVKASVMSSRDGVAISDLSLPDNPLVFVNPAFEKLTGYFSEEIMGKNCRFLQHPDVGQQDQVKIIRETIDSKKSCLVILKNYRKDGSMFWNQLSLSPVFNDAGEPSHYLGVQRQVPDHVMMQEATVRKNGKSIFKRFSLGEHAIVSITNLTGDITYVNDNFCAISDYDREELLAKNLKIISSEEHSNIFFLDAWRSISSGRIWHGEVKSTCKMGSHYWTKTTIVPILDDKGRPYQYVYIGTEITEPRQIEERLKRTAYHDEFTDLTNCLSVVDRSSHAGLQCQRYYQSLVAILSDVDDFGWEYSLPAHSVYLSTHSIKIDQTFVRDSVKNADNLVIVEEAIALAKTLRHLMIAEGLETTDVVSALSKLDSHLTQSCEITRPMSADDIPDWVSEWKADDVWTYLT